MSRLPTPGGDDGTWGNILNDFLAAEHNPDGSQKTLLLTKGGTGATDAATARSSLGAVANTDSRLSDARSPTAHKSTHAVGGTDALAPSDINAVAKGELVFNVKDYGAKGDGATDDAAAINAAIVAANAAAGSTVLLPAGTYKIGTTLSMKSYVRLLGAGPTLDGKGSVLAPSAGVNAVTVPHNTVAWEIESLAINGGAIGILGQGETSGVLIRDVCISSCSSHGIQTDVFEHFLIEYVKITGVGGTGWLAGQVVSGNGRTERGSLDTVRIDSVAGDGIYIDSQVGYGSSLTFANVTFITVKQNALRLKSVASATFLALNLENASTQTDNTYDGLVVTGNSSRLTFIGCNMNLSGSSPNAQRYAYNIGGAGLVFIGCAGNARTKVWNVTGYAYFIGCAGSATLGDWFSTADSLLGGMIGGSMVIDDQNAPLLKPSSIPSAAGASQVFFLADSNLNGTGTRGNWEWRRFDANRTRVMLMKDTGDMFNMSNLIVDGLNGVLFTKPKAGAPVDGDLNNAVDGAIVVDTTNRRLYVRSGGSWRPMSLGTGKRTALTYSATIATDASVGDVFTITATDGNAFTISNPTNLIDGQHVAYTIRNTSGGALGTATWGTTFKLATWTQPATANSRSITFRYDGTNLVEISRTPNDVPN